MQIRHPAFVLCIPGSSPGDNPVKRHPPRQILRTEGIAGAKAMERHERQGEDPLGIPPRHDLREIDVGREGNPHTRKRRPQRGDRGQRQHEVPQRPGMEDQAVHY
jgi:hypothetical protein